EQQLGHFLAFLQEGGNAVADLARPETGHALRLLRQPLEDALSQRSPFWRVLAKRLLHAADKADVGRVDLAGWADDLVHHLDPGRRLIAPITEDRFHLAADLVALAAAAKLLAILFVRLARELPSLERFRRPGEPHRPSLSTDPLVNVVVKRLEQRLGCARISAARMLALGQVVERRNLPAHL